MGNSPDYTDPNWLHEQYVVQDRTVPEMAERAGVTRSTIRKWMRRAGIETTGRGYVPDDTRYRDAEWLVYAYHEEGMTMHEMAEECDVTPSTIHRWMNKYGVESRDRGFSEGGYNPMKNPEVVEDHPVSGATGDDHPAYSGGHSHDWLKSEEWQETREEAIQMQGRSCERCGTTRQESYERHGEDLHVHHIVPVPDGGETFEHDNLAVLCRDCHEETHDHHDSPPYEPEV